MSRFGFLIAFVCLFSGTPVATYGQFSEQDRTRLIGGIESLEKNFDAAKLPAVGAAKENLLQSIAEVEKYLQGSTDPDDRMRG